MRKRPLFHFPFFVFSSSQYIFNVSVMLYMSQENPVLLGQYPLTVVFQYAKAISTYLLSSVNPADPIVFSGVILIRTSQFSEVHYSELYWGTTDLEPIANLSLY